MNYWHIALAAFKSGAHRVGCETADAEIADFHVPIRVDENVGRFYVAMH